MPNQPSSIVVRLAYSVALIFLALPQVLQIRYAYLLFAQMATNPNIVNPITATFLVVLFLVISIVVLYRIGGLLTGKFKLEVRAFSGPIYWLRVLAVTFLVIGFFIFVAGILGRFLSGVSAVLFVAGQFGMLMPSGLILFEFSRLLEREADEAEVD